MGFFDKYPYTDFHELNLDWLLAKMKEIDENLDRIKQEAIDAATENAKEYLDEQLNDFYAEFDQLKIDFETLNLNVESLNNQFVSFTNYVNSEILKIQQRVDADMAAINASTDQKIADAKNELFNDLSTELANIKVINFFTGELVSVQDMFNYLSMLHISDSIDYDTMAYRAKTYSQLVALNINYTNLVMHGNTLYV